ncbi:hypothetical protein GALL_520960 [mine drainage metagenome]|uniref:Uncharacterized protein n=1 Tax=mine drainage metagenome TaxID=410659 RepID=A0A1J5P6F0_9ZZZZ
MASGLGRSGGGDRQQSGETGGSDQCAREHRGSSCVNDGRAVDVQRLQPPRKRHVSPRRRIASKCNWPPEAGRRDRMQFVTVLHRLDTLGSRLGGRLLAVPIQTELPPCSGAYGPSPSASSSRPPPRRGQSRAIPRPSSRALFLPRLRPNQGRPQTPKIGRPPMTAAGQQRPNRDLRGLNSAAPTSRSD